MHVNNHANTLIVSDAESAPIVCVRFASVASRLVDAFRNFAVITIL